ncbi:Flagellar biosynthesis protein FlgA [Hyphomicrobiales bacterium]|nr:Flagellar biosynthesis protein FlgA [Hyphomicrobiales bacterium]CAH1695485.1 Flagellar biosynthesis protein FlgA [Hyphomicrobiales bacterium]
MNYHRYFSAVKAVETCLVGTGGFGRSFLAQGLHVPLMTARVAVDLDAQSVVRTMCEVGIPADRIRVCNSASEAKEAWEEGDFIATADLSVVIDLPFDVLVEATGHPESGARHSRMAVEAGKHLALVSKEVDSVVGSGLARMAAQRGLVVTPVDGDQPSLLIGLVTWAQTMGFEIVAAGKASEYDFVFDPEAETLSANGTTVPVPGFSNVWVWGERTAAEICGLRADFAAALPQRAVPDLCELLIVANATGFAPDVANLHAPIARICDVPDLLCEKADGGLLAGCGRLDVFHCLRRPEEISFAGGVFVVVRCRDKASWEMLAAKGHVVSRDLRHALLYLPRHLLGLEAATSVLEAALLGVSSGGISPRPHFDLIARAERDLPAGTLLHMGGHHHTIDGVSSELVPAVVLGDGQPAPFYLAANRCLVRDVAKGETIDFDHLAIEPESELLALRRIQDRFFLDGATNESLAEAS